MHRETTQNTSIIKKLVNSGLAWIWISVILLILDRVTKMWAIEHLNFQEPLRVLPFLNLNIAYNKGAAFNFLHHASGWQNVVLGGLAFIISGIVLIWLSRLPIRAYWLAVALALILGGALGNAWDRILYGYVIDFLSFHWGSWYFAIFNLADSAICVGTFMVLMHWLKTDSK